jgi:putative phosphoribosyl transferase
MGAIASGNVRVLQSDVVSAFGVPLSAIEKVTAEEMRELVRHERAIRGNRPSTQIRNREIILVDDGLATGSTMYAAVASLKQQRPLSIIVAVPVAAREACDEFRNAVDKIICLRTPEPFLAVGRCYEMFPQLTDEDVREFLRKAGEFHTTPAPSV